MCGAEPQADGGTMGRHHLNHRKPPINSIERKADTVKTYILRPLNPVEPQRTRSVNRPAARPKVAKAQAQSQALFIGLDVHTQSIAPCLAPSHSTELRPYGLIGGTHDDVLRLLKKLSAAHPDHPLKICYEAGPHGYPLCRCLRAHGYDCIIVAPSKVPRKPGDRVKTNRRDAQQLARLYRAGELTAIYVPDPQDEAVRDLIRARFQVGRQQHRARQQLKMFLLRHNIRYAGKTSWNAAHLRYLAQIKMPFPVQQILFQEMLNVISEASSRLERLDQEIERAVPGWRWYPLVRALMALRGIALLHAATLVAELGDLNRFAHPSQLMGYLGLVPSEDTTGEDRRQGGITQMGNGPARRALVEAAWNYRSPARITPQLRKRQEGLPKAVTDISWNAQRRLHHRFVHLTRIGRKKSQVAVTAVARELSGFVWAIGQLVQPLAQPDTAASNSTPTSLTDVSSRTSSPRGIRRR
jgi:transposase